MANNNRQDNEQGQDTKHSNQENGISASKSDIRTGPFCHYCLLHFLLSLFSFLNTLFSPSARGVGRAITVCTHTHVLHATAHLAVIALSLLLRVSRCSDFFRLPRFSTSHTATTYHMFPALHTLMLIALSHLALH